MLYSEALPDMKIVLSHPEKPFYLFGLTFIEEMDHDDSTQSAK
jgi:hypothetical protein